METKKESEAPLLTRMVVDGVEFPVGEAQPALLDDVAMTRMFDMIAALEDAEGDRYILSAATSHA